MSSMTAYAPPCFAVRTRIQVLKSEGIGCNLNKGV